ncbi:lytic murein transglycosylase [Rhodobacterales bacterium HKCCE3408]|nr:lytic murein transglycosylase [Rhodobacterales bacterium HKCCE3408]
MVINRRTFGAGMSALSVAACTGGFQSVAPGAGDDLRPVRNADYDRWIAGFRSRALSQGFPDSLLDAAFRGTGYLPGVVARDRDQTEFSRTLEDYLSITVSDARVAAGRTAAVRHRSTLAAIEAEYGVDANIVAAIWGVESFYGDRMGDIPVISATSTLAYDGRRGAFFEEQLIAALRILSRGDTSAAGLNGSWAGAMGHTQFIPTSFLAFAVDFTGDGRRDIWSDDPSDALASTAAYLARSGWQSGLSWGREVERDAGLSGTVIQPQAGGPRFATTANFRAIKRYNNSDAYAIGVGHLADRIAGGPPLRTPFPPDEFGMTRDNRIALQEALTESGFDTGGADGVIGSRSRRAISDYQRAAGLTVTGDPSLDLLRRLR